VSFRLARSTEALTLCGFLLLVVTLIGLIMPHTVPGRFGIGYGEALHRFVLLMAAQAVVYGAAVALLLRAGAKPSLWLVLGTAALLRLPVLAAPPFLSNDMYRYIWDGWVQARGINPYLYIPADPHLMFLRDAAVYPNINRANYAHTIYPPAAEMLFWLFSRIGAVLAAPVLAMKCGMLAFEALAIWAILELLKDAGLPRRRVLIYAWNPVPLWEFAGSGHVDALAVGFAALALLAVSRGRSLLGGSALAAAVLVKFLPAVLLPAVWRRRDWRFPAAFAAVAAASYLPYLGAGVQVFGFLGGYAAEEKITSGSGVYLPDLLGITGIGAKFYFALVLLGLGAIGLAMLARPAADTRAIAARAGLLIGVTMLGISPHYPWYYAWVLLPACITGSPALIYLASASLLLYLDPTHTGLLWQSFVFIPCLAFGGLEIAWRAQVKPACKI
jgi:alpha-1,6-mannosyltransferase